MTRAYSNDPRERVVFAIEAGEATRSAAIRFGIAISTVVKWHQRWRETVGVAPARMGGYRPFILDPHDDIYCFRLLTNITTATSKVCLL